MRKALLEENDLAVELLGGSETVFSPLLERLPEGFAHLGRHLAFRIGSGEGERRIEQVSAQQLARAFAHEGVDARQELVENDSQRVEVAAPIEFLPGGKAPELLRRGVLELPE